MRAMFLVLNVMLAMACGGSTTTGDPDIPQDPSECCWLWPVTSAIEECVHYSWDDYEHDQDGCLIVECHPDDVDWFWSAHVCE